VPTGEAPVAPSTISIPFQDGVPLLWSNGQPALSASRRVSPAARHLAASALYPVSVQPTSSAIRSFFLNGPAGQLEALLNAGAPDATHAALICHPHPVYGGTLHNKVVFHAMKALNNLGMPALRFNFRGAGLSPGEHDNGTGEVDDVRAALDWLDHEFHLPMIFAGFSFGAAVGLRAACPDPRVPAVISLGTPISPVDNRSYDYDFMTTCAKPKLFVSGSRDQFAPKAKLEALVASFPEPKKLVIIEAADHFFEGRLREMRETVEGWVKTVLRRE
jgi:alpha/beta superfamily hydrolase